MMLISETVLGLWGSQIQKDWGSLRGFHLNLAWKVLRHIWLRKGGIQARRHRRAV